MVRPPGHSIRGPSHYIPTWELTRSRRSPRIYDPVDTRLRRLQFSRKCECPVSGMPARSSASTLPNSTAWTWGNKRGRKRPWNVVSPFRRHSISQPVHPVPGLVEVEGGPGFTHRVAQTSTRDAYGSQLGDSPSPTHPRDTEFPLLRRPNCHFAPLHYTVPLVQAPAAREFHSRAAYLGFKSPSRFGNRHVHAISPSPSSALRSNALADLYETRDADPPRMFSPGSRPRRAPAHVFAVQIRLDGVFRRGESTARTTTSGNRGGCRKTPSLERVRRRLSAQAWAGTGNKAADEKNENSSPSTRSSSPRISS
uniref:Uncharacterized protein n=1 Tax=Mycena chlorophos TaxID=658473 RepID=A0ABQ0KW27_MYCCL|nr:predicted protein [Mycena chlorophos]